MLKAIKISRIFYFLFLTSFSFSQTNLVPNPSFEDTVNCRKWLIRYLIVKTRSSFRDSPDYFNSCDPTLNNVSTPYNFGGFQIPKTGTEFKSSGIKN